MNFNCVYPSCNYKQNDIEEDKFLAHLREEHQKEMDESAKKEGIPIEMVEMMSVSNSKVFINLRN